MARFNPNFDFVTDSITVNYFATNDRDRLLRLLKTSIDTAQTQNPPSEQV